MHLSQNVTRPEKDKHGQYVLELEMVNVSKKEK